MYSFKMYTVLIMAHLLAGDGNHHTKRSNPQSLIRKLSFKKRFTKWKCFSPMITNLPGSRKEDLLRLMDKYH